MIDCDGRLWGVGGGILALFLSLFFRDWQNTRLERACDVKSRGTQTLLGLILRQHESGFWIEHHRGFISTTRIPERGLSSTLSGVVACLSDAAHASHRDLTPRSSMLLPTCSSPATQRAPEPLDAAVQRRPGGPSVHYRNTLVRHRVSSLAGWCESCLRRISVEPVRLGSVL